MTESWTIAHADLRCHVRWDGTNLLWQLQHPQGAGRRNGMDANWRSARGLPARALDTPGQRGYRTQ